MSDWISAARVNATALMPVAITTIVWTRANGPTSGRTSPRPTPEIRMITWKNASAPLQPIHR